MKHRANYTRFRKPIHGFTLVELLVVIAIIALLLSILMPALSRGKQQALRVRCLNNMRQQYLSHSLYAGDNRGKFVFHGDEAPDYARGTDVPNTMWDAMRKSYLTNGEILYCPALRAVRGMGDMYTNSKSYINGYGGWDSIIEPTYVVTAYFWLPNYRERTWRTGNKPVYKFRATTGENINERFWPENMTESSSRVVVSTHRLMYAPLYSIFDDFGHLGSGRNFDVSASDFHKKLNAIDAPVGLGDGSSTYHTKANIRPRAVIFGNWEIWY